MTTFPGADAPPEPASRSATADTRHIDLRYASRWRSTLLLVLPFGVLAFVTARILEGASGQAPAWDAAAYPVLAAGLALMWGVLLVRPRALAEVLLTITGVVSVFFAAKLAWVLFLVPAGVDPRAQMTENFFWIPVIYLLSFILPDLRRGRSITLVFTVVMLLMSLGYTATTGRTDVELGVVYALVQMNLANTVFFALTSAFTGLREEYTRTHARMEATEHFAFTDPLTTLPNRHRLMERLRMRLDDPARAEAPFALLFLDLDGFKAVNDSLGHAGGDALLRQVALRLRDTLRGSDFVARISGDEFVVVVDGASTRGVADEVARRLLDAMVRPFELDAHALRVSVSVGVVLYPDDGRDADTLMRHADSAMYRVKRAGRNGVSHYLSEPDEKLHRERLLERDLSDAVQNGELALAYQSLHDLETGEVRGLEALVRWHHPKLGEVSPCHFVPVAEKSGLIVGIGAWVLDEACRQAKAWEREGLRGFTVSVNVSPLQFSHPGFVDTLLTALRRHDLAPRRLELELTETIVLQDLARVADTLAQLQRLGIRIAIDDFGTGYSSLAYLQDLPIDTIKIDRAFVRDLSGRGGSAASGVSAFAPALVQAIVSLATSLDLDIVAEGIETDEQRGMLRDLGCRGGQGYLFSRPMAADAVPAFLERSVAVAAPVGPRASTEPRLLS